jgi:DNA-binding SARP family transcriptional activator
MSPKSSTALDTLAETTLPLFEHKLQGKPFVIIYPRHRSRTALVSMFLRVYQDRMVYYSLNEDDNTLTAWLNHMLTDAALPVDFGTQTRAALTTKGVTPEDLAAAFGADLFMLRSDPYMFLLDMFDRLEMSDAVDRFFRALPAKMPSHAQIVLHARLLDLQPWNDLLNAGHAEVVGNEQALGGGIYGDEQAHGQLEVLALSGGRVYIDGRPVTSWDGSLPRHLFYYFVDHSMVTRDEIFDVFWPNMPVKEATNVFHVTKRKISERLGYELTSYSGGFYVPSPRLTVHYDVRTLESAVEQAIEFEQDAPALWYQAVQLYRYEFLPNVRTSWAQTRREAIKNKYAQALIGLGRYHRGLNEPDRALGYLQRALREKPDWEDVHQDVMMIYYQQGRRDDAILQYRLLEKTLNRMFGIKPSKETRQLYDVISAV